MSSLTKIITQISGFSNSDPEIFKESVIALTSTLWIMNVLMNTNFIVGLTKRDQSIFNEAKDVFATEMKRLKFNLNDFQVDSVLSEYAPTLLQVKLHQKTDKTLAAVNVNLQTIIKDPSMDLSMLYKFIFKENSGVCLYINGLDQATAIEVRDLLLDLANELKTSSLTDMLNLYAKPQKIALNKEIGVSLYLTNPWNVNNNKPGLYIYSSIFNDYNSPFKILASIHNIIFYINQICTNEKDQRLFDSVKLSKLRNWFFGQSFQYIT